jgi:hypothetical protein
MTLDDKLYDYLFPATGMAEGKFIEAHADKTAYKKPYATWQVVSNPQVGEVLTYDIDADGNQPYATNRTATVQVDFYGQDSSSSAYDFVLRLQGEEASERGYLLNLSFLSSLQPVDTSQALGDTWERRFSVRLNISNTVEALQQVGIIEAVEIEPTFTGGAIDPKSNLLIIEDV